MSATLVSFFYLKETLVHDGASALSNSVPPMSTWEVVKAPGVGVVLIIYGQVALHGLAFTAMAPLSWFTSIENGGFDFPEQYIAAALAIGGLCQSLFMLLAFPPLHLRFGTGSILRACALLWPFLFLSFPIFNQFRRHHWETQFWVSAPVVWGFLTGVSMAFSMLIILVTARLINHSMYAIVYQ